MNASTNIETLVDLRDSLFGQIEMTSQALANFLTMNIAEYFNDTNDAEGHLMRSVASYVEFINEKMDFAKNVQKQIAELSRNN